MLNLAATRPSYRRITVRAFALILAAFGLLLGPTGFGQDAQGDKERIQGTWKIVSFEARGKTKLLPPDAIKNSKIVFSADKMTFHFGKEITEASFTLDHGKKPKTIDMIGIKEKNAKRVPGIYLLEGDDLKLCWDANCESRPTEFTKDGKRPQDLRLVVLKREKKK
jgi:uncharacterized protein (TIGR03067 family)